MLRPLARFRSRHTSSRARASPAVVAAVAAAAVVALVAALVLVFAAPLVAAALVVLVVEAMVVVPLAGPPKVVSVLSAAVMARDWAMSRSLVVGMMVLAAILGSYSASSMLQAHWGRSPGC